MSGQDCPAAWDPDSWRSRPARQMPEYPDEAALQRVEKVLAGYPPLALPSETEALRARLAESSAGRAFVMQGGDCAESFAGFGAAHVEALFRLIMQISVVLTYGMKRPVVKIARAAGQFAKPRSRLEERRGDEILPAYRGDIINDSDFDAAARDADPQRMLQAYFQSAATMNFLRSMAQGGYADLHKVHEWNMAFSKSREAARRYIEMSGKIMDSLDFMSACLADEQAADELVRTELYTAHEGLLLNYEQALTRHEAVDGKWYDTSAHFLWIGDRTRSQGGAHVEFFRGVANPLGVKVGPSLGVDELCRLLDILNPGREPGRLTLISRMGVGRIESLLPPLLRCTKREGCPVTWICDPMHGNTRVSADGYKTRAFDSILQEIREFFAIAGAEGVYPGGIHVEMTGKDVTECTGGFQGISEEHLPHRYDTLCDPRLNATQTLELAFLLADTLGKA